MIRNPDVLGCVGKQGRIYKFKKDIDIGFLALRLYILYKLDFYIVMKDHRKKTSQNIYILGQSGILAIVGN